MSANEVVADEKLTKLTGNVIAAVSAHAQAEVQAEGLLVAAGTGEADATRDASETCIVRKQRAFAKACRARNARVAFFRERPGFAQLWFLQPCSSSVFSQCCRIWRIDDAGAPERN